MRSFALHALVLATGLAFGAPAAGQEETPAIPPGFTAYQLVGQGINAPPIPLRIEADRIISPEGPEVMITVTGSEVSADRMSMQMSTPFGPARFVGVREGDAFAGYLFVEMGDERGAVPVALVPVGQATDLSPGSGDLSRGPGISRVEIVPGDVSLKSGERRAFVARVFNDSGAEVTSPEVKWFAMGGSITEAGEFVGLNAGERMVIALVDGKAVATTTVTVAEPEIASLAVYTDVPARLAVGSRVPLEVHGLNAIHRWEFEPDLEITSTAPSVLAIEGETLVAVAPGRATVTVASGQASEEYAIEVVAAGQGFAITGVPEGPVRTGDVVTLGTTVADARPAWSVVGSGAAVHAASDFVAEKPGAYTIVGTLGDRVATSRIEVEPREVPGRFHVVGRGTNPDLFTADIWPQNSYVYLGTHQANQIRTYDVSDPASPVLTDSVTVDARVINSVKVSRNGKWLAATREGAANRRNGIVLYSLEDPAHPEAISEYTETVTSGVHNVFWATDSILYLTNDGTGDMNIIDVSDPYDPKEIGRWGLPVVGKSLHDIWVQDGFVWMSYMMDGLVILDIGGGGKGGTPEKPVMLSRIFYPDGPTHNAFRYGDYLFVGDEDFSLQGTKPALPAGLSANPRGEVHVIDISDPENPWYAARYEVPEAGAHNLWVKDGVMYVGYYQAGLRAVDVTGKLRGDLYRQGREIAHFLPQSGPDDAMLPYAPMVWGVFPMFENGWQPVGDVWFVTDYNSGLWTMKLVRPEEERPIS
ncbi:MAG TPA: hypothetical protein VM737_02310 [Gemmatimonadota bacterium]|nr:hypothetical protein [Gemmatimonadota bacterium]